MNQETTRLLPQLDMTVLALLEHWPGCARVFNERRMACVGCELSAFETIADAARVYDVDVSQFLAALKAAVGPAAEDH